MRIVRTLVFILLFAFAAGVYLFQVRLSKQSVTNVPDEVNRNVTLTTNDVIDLVAIRDHVQKTEVELRKKDGSWRLEVPVRYPAEGQIVEGLAVTARMASRQPRLRAEKEWAEYGLSSPDMEITFGLPNERRVTLFIGTQVPVGKAIYARWAEERGYFLLSSEMKSVFRQSVYGLRKKRIFRGSPDMFRKISMDLGPHSYEWKKDGADWYWFEPVSKFGKKVPADQVNAVLATLLNLHVKEFQDNMKKSKAELGIFMIHDRIRIESEGAKSENFHFGNEVPERSAYYGLREGEAPVFFVDRGKVIELLDLMKVIAAENPEEDRKKVAGGEPGSDEAKAILFGGADPTALFPGKKIPPM